MERRQRLDRDLLRAARLDDALANHARRRRDRDQNLVGPVVAKHVLQIVGRPEHPDAVHAEVALARVVVDETDRRVVQVAVALHLADQELRCVAGADDQHLLAVGDDAGLGPLDQRAGEQPTAGDEREQEQVVERSDSAREPRGRLGRERVQHEIRERAGDRDAAEEPPHVARRDVAPPAVVEAEDHERREVDHDDERDHPGVEQVPVVDRGRLVEAQEERQAPRRRDQDRVEDELPDPVPVDRERLHEATGSSARSRTDTTRCCCSGAIPAQSGRQRFSRAAFSASGKSPSR